MKETWGTVRGLREARGRQRESEQAGEKETQVQEKRGEKESEGVGEEERIEKVYLNMLHLGFSPCTYISSLRPSIFSPPFTFCAHPLISAFHHRPQPTPSVHALCRRPLDALKRQIKNSRHAGKAD